jgi:hypothetical protein
VNLKNAICAGELKNSLELTIDATEMNITLYRTSMLKSLDNTTKTRAVHKREKLTIDPDITTLVIQQTPSLSQQIFTNCLIKNTYGPKNLHLTFPRNFMLVLKPPREAS